MSAFHARCLLKVGEIILDNISGNPDIDKLLLKQYREKYKGTAKPGVSIVVPTFKSSYIGNIFKNFIRLSYPVKELIIILNSSKLNTAEYMAYSLEFQNIKIFELDEDHTLGECLNFGISKSNYDFISKMDDDDYYGANYLTDLMNVFNYTDAQVTGKNPVYVYFEDKNSLYLFYSRKPIIGGTLLFRKSIREKIQFRSLNFREDNYFILDCIRAGIKIHPADKYNYVYIRHSNQAHHTFKMLSEDFIQEYNMKKILAVRNFPPFVTV